MYTVYLIRSLSNPNKKYIGYTTDFQKRLQQHNDGFVPVTKTNVPWKAEVLVRFESQRAAKDFERYLKHGSGHAFAQKHFWNG